MGRQKMIIRLDNDQLKALSNIMADIGQVALGSSVVPFLSGVDKANPTVVLSGLVITFGFWVLSIIFAKRRK